MAAQEAGGGAIFAPGDTLWHIIASDMTAYTTEAALRAAGKVPWPGLDQGMFLASLIASTRTATDAAGDDAYIAFNKGAAFAALANDAARDAQAFDLIFTGSQLSIAGVNHLSSFMIDNVWCRLITGTDKLVLSAT